VDAVEDAFAGDIDYSMLVKMCLTFRPVWLISDRLRRPTRKRKPLRQQRQLLALG
jgi:hypothetical protein